MTKAELKAVHELAITNCHTVDLSHIDESPLHGLYTREFQAPVHTTLPVVAKMMRHLCLYIFTKNGLATYDTDAHAEFCRIAKQKIVIVG